MNQTHRTGDNKGYPLSVTIDRALHKELIGIKSATGDSLSKIVNGLIVDFFALRNARVYQHLKMEAFRRGKAPDRRNVTPKQIMETVIQIVEDQMLGIGDIRKNEESESESA